MKINPLGCQQITKQNVKLGREANVLVSSLRELVSCGSSELGCLSRLKGWASRLRPGLSSSLYLRQVLSITGYQLPWNEDIFHQLVQHLWIEVQKWILCT